MASRQLFISFTGEGCTDNEFLIPIIKRTVDDLVFERGVGDIDVDEIRLLKVKKTGKSFAEYVVDAAEEALGNGSQLMIVHSDSDRDTYEQRYEHKFLPAYEALNNSDDDEVKAFEKKLIPIIPIRMIEAWMLADHDLLKENIGTQLSDADLGISGAPESIADPEAIRTAQANQTYKRKTKVSSISELYGYIANQMDINKLKHLSAYNRFVGELERGLRLIGYFH